MKIMGITTCSTVKKALKWFDENKITYEFVDLREHPPTQEDLKTFHDMSGLDIKYFFNTSGKMYRELDMKNKRNSLSDQEIYGLMSKHPMLIKRPLIVDEQIVVIGFKEAEYKKYWLNN